MTIGEKIKAKRLEKGLTQKALGELAGIAEPTIRRYEAGKLNPKIETISKIANGLGVTPAELIGPEWFDLQIGAENVKSLQRSVNLHSGIIAALEEIYGVAEEKGIMGESGLECP